MELATITGTIYRNDGSRWPYASVLFIPLWLASTDQTTETPDSMKFVKTLIDANGTFTAKLWPGQWKVFLPDSESHLFGVAPGQTVDLEALKGNHNG